MCTLEVLQPPPPVGYVTVCEQRGELVAIPELQDKVPLQVSNYNSVFNHSHPIVLYLLAIVVLYNCRMVCQMRSQCQ